MNRLEMTQVRELKFVEGAVDAVEADADAVAQVKRGNRASGIGLRGMR